MMCVVNVMNLIRQLVVLINVLQASAAWSTGVNSKLSSGKSGNFSSFLNDLITL